MLNEKERKAAREAKYFGGGSSWGLVDKDGSHLL